MWQDPIVAEVRRARQAYAERYHFDLQAMYRALKEQEEQNPREKVSFAARRIAPVDMGRKPALTD